MSHHDTGMKPDGERGLPAQSSDDDAEGHAIRARATDDPPIDPDGGIRLPASDDDDVEGHSWKIGTDQ